MNTLLTVLCFLSVAASVCYSASISQANETSSPLSTTSVVTETTPSATTAEPTIFYLLKKRCKSHCRRNAKGKTPNCKRYRKRPKLQQLCFFCQNDYKCGVSNSDVIG